MRTMAILVVFFSVFFARLISVQAACDKPSTVTELMNAGVKGEEAFAQMDLTGLLQLATAAREEIIPCLRAPLTTKQAAVFHRLMALEAFTRRNDAQVVAEFHAARRLAPGYEIPPEVAHEGHALRVFYDKALDAPDGDAESIYGPDKGHVVAGGVRNAPRMSKTPLIVQVYTQGDDPEAAWVETVYLQPGKKLPVWGKNPMGLTARDLGIDIQPLWQKPAPWYVSAGVSAAISATFYALAMNARETFDSRATPDEDLKDLRESANGWGYAAIATGSVAIALTATGLGFHLAFGGEDASKASVQLLLTGVLHD